MKFNNIYGKNENREILCVGLKGVDDIKPMPLKKYGQGFRIDMCKTVSEIVVFYNIKESEFYYIKILEYVKTKPQPRFIVEYSNKQYNIQCGDFIRGCHIDKIIRKPTNFIFKQGKDYVLRIITTHTKFNTTFPNGFVDILFNGSEETVQTVKEGQWYLHKKESSNFYVMGKLKGGVKKVYLHQIIFGKTHEGKVIDHITGNTFDNRIENLREVTVQENNRNRKGYGYPLKSKFGWKYSFKTKEGIRLDTPSRKTYEQANMDALIVQKYYDIRHREEEWDKVDEYDVKYKTDLINSIEKKIDKKRIKLNKEID